MRIAAVIALLAASPALGEDRLNFSIAAGLGLAYDGLGLQAQMRHRNLAAFLAYGLSGCSILEYGGPPEYKKDRPFLRGHGAAGIQMSSGRGKGFVLSIVYSWIRCIEISPYVPAEHVDESQDWFAVTIGWRWRERQGEGWYFEAAAGPVAMHYVNYEAWEPGYETPYEHWEFGRLSGPQWDWMGPWWFPDLSFAIGYEF